MARNYITPAPPVGVGVFLATPTFHAPFTAYTWSLARTTAELVRHGIPFQLAIPEDVKNVDDGRNDLVRKFLEGTCTDLLFIDGDQRWEPGAVIKILSYDEDLVCGAYPYKSDDGTFPIGRIFEADENTGLLSVSYAPTGFMRIRRRVFDVLKGQQPQVKGTEFFFMRQFNGNTYDGGDVNFCRKWIKAGGKVKVDPHLFIEHVGIKHWGGRFSQYLADPENAKRHIDGGSDVNETVTDTKPAAAAQVPATVPAPVAREEVPKGLTEALEALQDGDDSEATFKALADAYGNKPWALSAEGLQTIWKMATNLKSEDVILECGSGISTAVLGIAAAKVGARVVTFEENGVWAEKVDEILAAHGIDATIQVRPITGDWYDTRNLPELNAALAVIDGPTRTRDRPRSMLKAAKLPGLVAPDAAVFFDDARETQFRSVVGGFMDVDAGPKPMVIGRLGEAAQKAVA